MGLNNIVRIPTHMKLVLYNNNNNNNIIGLLCTSTRSSKRAYIYGRDYGPGRFNRYNMSGGKIGLYNNNILLVNVTITYTHILYRNETCSTGRFWVVVPIHFFFPPLRYNMQMRSQFLSVKPYCARTESRKIYIYDI